MSPATTTSPGHNTASLLSSVIKLTPDTYHDWKFTSSLVMQRAGCYDVVHGLTACPQPVTNADGTTTTPKPTDVAAWETLSREGLTIIGLTVSSEMVKHIRHCKTAPEAYRIFADMFEREGRANRISLKRQLYSYVHDATLPIHDYITGITSLASRLESIGVPLSDEDITDVMIANLHPDYSSVGASLTHSPGILTVRSVAASLVEAEQHLRLQQGQTLPLPGNAAYAARHISRSAPRSSTSSSAPSSSRKNGCYRCGEPGHIARDCPAPAPVPAASPSSAPSNSSSSTHVANLAMVHQAPPLELF